MHVGEARDGLSAHHSTVDITYSSLGRGNAFMKDGDIWREGNKGRLGAV
jgi:hypothetical protein